MRAHVLALAIAALGAAPLAAQQDVNVTAIVPSVSPPGAAVSDLAFGSLVPSASGDVIVEVTADQRGATHAGEFSFDLSGTRGVEFGFTLPAALASSTGATLPIRFDDPRYGAHCIVGGGSTCTLTNFAPATGSLQICRTTLGNGNCHPTRVFPAGSVLSIFLGGAVTVAPTQRAGDYTGTITVTILQVD